MKILTRDTFFICSESVFHWVVWWNWVNQKSPAVPWIISQALLYLAVRREVSRGGSPLQSWVPRWECVLLWPDLGQRPPRVPAVWVRTSPPASPGVAVLAVWSCNTLASVVPHWSLVLALSPGLLPRNPRRRGRLVLWGSAGSPKNHAVTTQARPLCGGRSLFLCALTPRGDAFGHLFCPFLSLSGIVITPLDSLFMCLFSVCRVNFWKDLTWGSEDDLMSTFFVDVTSRSWLTLRSHFTAVV